MNRTQYLLIALAAVLVLGTGAYATYALSQPVPQVVAPLPPEVATTTPETPPAPAEPAPAPVRAYGSVTLAIGDRAVFKDVSIRVLELVEDSRCPANANCVWAGTVRVKLESVSGMGTSVQTIEVGKIMTTEAEQIAFTAVSPTNRSVSVTVPAKDYRFTFSVTKRVAQGSCYVGGCSSQICSDTPDMASTCEFRAEYACYRGARCERQASGACGWTQTSELKACLASPPPL